MRFKSAFPLTPALVTRAMQVHAFCIGAGHLTGPASAPPSPGLRCHTDPCISTWVQVLGQVAGGKDAGGEAWETPQHSAQLAGLLHERMQAVQDLTSEVMQLLRVSPPPASLPVSLGMSKG